MTPKYVTIHCSDTPNGKSCDIEVIRKWHIEERGWKDIGYHIVIQPNGEVQHGRSLVEIGAHVESYNLINGYVNIGICLIGTDKYTPKQFDSLDFTIHALQQSYDILESDIYVHNEFPTAVHQGKTCPGMRSGNLVAWYITKGVNHISKYLLPKGAW